MRFPIPTLTALVILALAFADVTGASAQQTVALKMGSGWLRRDWDECEDPSRLIQTDRSITIQTEKSASLYWQVPTRHGPMPIDTDEDWIQDCDRPPRDFASELQEMDQESGVLLDIQDHRYLSWKWRVSNTVDDSETVDRKGKVQLRGDDFAAKFGISMLRKGSTDLREIAYVWTRSLPKESVLVQEKRILFWKFKYHRIVAESGEENAGSWVNEVRDLYADYKRIYPDEEPGRIVRVYVMTDSDNTQGAVTGSFSDLAFHRSPP